MLDIKKTRLQLGVFLLSVVMTSIAVGLSFPFSDPSAEALRRSSIPEHNVRESSLVAWLQSPEAMEYGLFFGPSTTQYGIIPQGFDEAMAMQGHRVMSFNMGLPGANAHETDYHVRHTLETIERNKVTSTDGSLSI